MRLDEISRRGRRVEGGVVTTLVVRSIGTTPCVFIWPGRRTEAVRGVRSGGQRRAAGLGGRGGDGRQLGFVIGRDGHRVHHDHGRGRESSRAAAKSIPGWQ